MFSDHWPGSWDYGFLRKTAFTLTIISKFEEVGFSHYNILVITHVYCYMKKKLDLLLKNSNHGHSFQIILFYRVTLKLKSDLFKYFWNTSTILAITFKTKLQETWCSYFILYFFFFFRYFIFLAWQYLSLNVQEHNFFLNLWHWPCCWWLLLIEW